MPKVNPAGEVSTGRAGRGRRMATSLAEINVVPLVDVMLVLLVIFMVTAPMIQRGMDVNIPVSRRAQAIEGERVFVTVPAEYARNGMVAVGSEVIRVSALQERIRQKMETLATKQVYLQADKSVLYGDLYDVIDRLKAAGVENVGMVAQEPTRK
jgi:biopolymer transport protein ExbD